MGIPRVPQSVPSRRLLRWVLVAALVLYALMVFRAASVIPRIEFVLANYVRTGSGSATWVTTVSAVGVGSLVLAALVWFDRKGVRTLTWVLLILGVGTWIGFAVRYGSESPTDIGYPGGRIMFTYLAGIGTLLLVSWAIREGSKQSGDVERETDHAQEAGDPFAERRRSQQRAPIQVLTVAVVINAVTILAWGWIGPSRVDIAEDTGELEFVGTYEPVANACLAADMSSILDQLGPEPLVRDFGFAKAQENQYGFYRATCEVVPERWAGEFSPARGFNDLAVQSIAGMYAVTISITIREKNFSDVGVPTEECDLTELPGSRAPYKICRDDPGDFMEGVIFGVQNSYVVRHVSGNTGIICRLGMNEVPDRDAVIAAVDGVCATAFETIHDQTRR